MATPLLLWAVAAPLLLAHAAAPMSAALAPLPARRAEAMQNLVAWVQERGGFVSDRLQVGCIDGRGVAVCARGEILQGEALLSVPGELDLRRSVVPEESLLLTALNQPRSWGTQLSAHIALQLERRDAGATADSQASYAPFWQALDLDACCAHMAYFRAPAEWELLRGSAEFHRRSEYDRLTRLASELAGLAEDDPDFALDALNETKFVMANDFISTHAFTDTEACHRLMPLAINLNHDVQARAGAAWHWDGEEDVLHIVAARRIAPGEEVTISYGLKSNAQLMSTYGFTLEPAAEPVFSYRAAAVAQLLPQRASAKDLNFRVRLVTVPLAPPNGGAAAVTAALRRLGALRELLRRASAEGLRPEDMLSDLVQAFLGELEQDEVIRAFVAQLRENRRQAGGRGSAVWWRAEGAASGPEDTSSAEAVGSRWRSDVVRMKMSEYLCLLTYSEALDLRAGALTAEEALPQAVALVPLVDALLRA